ncbi:hypothetical protein [Streptomyces sp. NPDC046909]|uniref:hypothetical protein n=1 Tax=Streptomyces sp. NPDC046909 TaxID=3155617 RepID=UPI00340C3AF9
MTQERYHLTLILDGKPARHGWWGDETVARGKFTLWVSECSGKPGSSVTLVDEETETVVASWPDAT